MTDSGFIKNLENSIAMAEQIVKLDENQAIKSYYAELLADWKSTRDKILGKQLDEDTEDYLDRLGA